MTLKPKVIFVGKERSTFFNTLRANVDEYFNSNKISSYADTGMVFKTVILLSAYFVPYILMLVFHVPTFLMFIFFAIMGLAMAGIGMSVMHDANHSAYSKNDHVNKWVGFTLNLMGGAVCNWKMQHNRLHHTFTNVHDMDDDINSGGVLRLSPNADHKYIHRFQHLYAFGLYSLLTINWITVKDFSQLFRYKKNGVYRGGQQAFNKDLLKVALIKCFYFFYMLVVPIVFFGYHVLPFVMGFLVLHFICGFVLSVIFQLAHTLEDSNFPVPNEKGHVENEWAIHQLATTANFARHNRFLNWYIGGLNFQVEHHLFPGICHVHYRSLSDIVKKTADEYNVPYREHPTFWHALASHFSLLRQLGQNRVLIPVAAAA